MAEAVLVAVVGELFRHVQRQVFWRTDLEDDLNMLKNERDRLESVYWDVRNRVELAEQQQLHATNEVRGWLQVVMALLREADEIIRQGEQVSIKCWGTPQIFGARLKIRRNMKKMLMDLRMNGQDVFCLAPGVGSPPRPSLEGTPMDTIVANRPVRLSPEETPMDTIVADRPVHPSLEEINMDRDRETDTLFHEVRMWVEDDSVGVIGIYGMDGVGKTTLLTKIHNHFSYFSDRRYDYIFFILVGKECSPEKIQRSIWRKLNISDLQWESMNPKERVVRTSILLREKRFLLFLDDIWKRIDVHKDIGIPRSTDDKLESKIIFTTKFEQVCKQIRAQKRKEVPALPLETALQLFKLCVRQEEFIDAVGNNAEFVELIGKCKGLPLAIKIFGKAMATKRSLDEWEDAIRGLKNSPLKDEVFKLLMFGYECLPDVTHQKCFLSSVQYPNDYQIPREELVELWVAEGLLGVNDDGNDVHDDGNDVQKARDYGKSVLNSLVQASMLEAVTEMNVKMHDLVRDIALWIVRDNGTNKNKVLVQQAFDPKKWKAAEKISFWDSCVVFTLPIQSLSCPNLRTLILRYARMRSIPYGFFPGMPSLEVLDLQGNFYLVKLPDDIGELKNLQYLNLLFTDLRSLPMGMQNLKKLRYLLLSNIRARFLKKLIPNCIDLRLFGWWPKEEDVDVEDGVAMIEALECLRHLCEVHLVLWNYECTKKLQACHKLLKCISSLATRESFEFWSSYIRSPELPTSLSTRSMERLSSLTLQSSKREALQLQLQLLSQFPPWSPKQKGLIGNAYYFPSLEVVSILGCGALIDLTTLIYNAPSLKWLLVESCLSLREVIKGEIEQEDATKLFASLTYLRLTNLPCLNSICRRTLRFPSIREVNVHKCPNLMKLPISDRVMATLRIVKGERDWWEKLQWEDQCIKLDIEQKIRCVFYETRTI